MFSVRTPRMISSLGMITNAVCREPMFANACTIARAVGCRIAFHRFWKPPGSTAAKQRRAAIFQLVVWLATLQVPRCCTKLRREHLMCLGTARLRCSSAQLQLLRSSCFQSHSLAEVDKKTCFCATAVMKKVAVMFATWPTVVDHA